MRIYRSKDVLQFWEETYEVLKPIWRPLFLNHRAMKGILKFESDQIKVAIRRNKKLENVLEDLIEQSIKKDDFSKRQNPFRDSVDTHKSTSKIENRERAGKRWGRTF